MAMRAEREGNRTNEKNRVEKVDRCDFPRSRLTLIFLMSRLHKHIYKIVADDRHHRHRRRRRDDEIAKRGRGSVAASLVSPGDLELTPFRAYSAIYYGHTRCSNNCANTTRDCLHT